MSDQVEALEPRSALAPLFEPLAINGCTLANRIAMAPMTRMFAVDGVLAESGIDYYRRRAEGGIGLILTEGIAISQIAAHTSRVPELATAEQQAVWKRVTQAVHGAGGKIMAQLWHTGLGRIRDMAARPEEPSIGPTEFYLDPDSPLVAIGGNHPQGRALGDAEILAVVEEYATAAANARACGFDGVELHGAHGYLIDQFLWTETNRRSDRWNGDVRDRTRFAVEIVKAIRARTGPHFPIGFRFSQWKLPTLYDVKSWATPAELEQALTPLVDAGVDFLDASTRRYWVAEFEGSPLTLAGWGRKITGLPTMAVGSVGLDGALDPTNAGHAEAPQRNLGHAIAMMERGEIDLLGVGRAAIANPDWANKVRDGRDGELHAYDAASLAQHV